MPPAFATNGEGRVADNDNALHWAGYLAHYLEDAYNRTIRRWIIAR